MATPKKTTLRPKRTKAETEQEFTEIQEELTAARETSEPKAEEARKARETETRASVEGLSVEAVVEKFQTWASKSQSRWPGFPTNWRRRSTAWQQCGKPSRSNKKSWSGCTRSMWPPPPSTRWCRISARKGATGGRNCGTAAAWEEESRNTERERKEQEELLKKAAHSARAEEYEYRKALERKKAQDKYEEETKLLARANKEKQEALEKSWREREAALKASEEEIQRLRNESTEFPVRLRQESEVAAAEAVRSSEQKFEQRILLLTKDSEG